MGGRARKPFGIQKGTDKAPRPVPTGGFAPLAAGILICDNILVAQKGAALEAPIGAIMDGGHGYTVAERVKNER